MISKIVIVCLVVAAVNATILPVNYGYAPAVKVVAPVYHAPTYAPKVVEKPQPYDFNYEIQTDDAGSLWQRESGDDYGNKQGSFGYRDANGVYRQVEYVADEAGFRPVIKTNEPGTANANPADVQITAEESPVKYEAPVKAYTHPKVVKIHAPVYHQPAVYAAHVPVYHKPAVYAAHVPVYHKPAVHAVVHAAPYGYSH